MDMCCADEERSWIVQVQVKKNNKKVVIYFTGEKVWTATKEEACLLTESEAFFIRDQLEDGDIIPFKHSLYDKDTQYLMDDFILLLDKE